MTKLIEKYILDTEEIYITENSELKEILDKLLNKLPYLSTEEWSEIFNLMSSNSLDGKVNVKEAYIVASSKILLGYALELKYMFGLIANEFFIFDSSKWIKIDLPILITFLKSATNKLGIPEYIASSVTFVNKLHKQFKQDAYFEKVVEKETTYINLINCTVVISNVGVKIEKHNPKYFLKYKLDVEYMIDKENNDFIQFIKSIVPSIEVQKSLQQSISQFLVKNFKNNKQVCLYGLNKNISFLLVEIMTEMIPEELIVIHFKDDNAKLEDLFINFEDIHKDAKSLEKTIFIPCENLSESNIQKNILNNKSGILNWIIDGALDIINNRQIYIANECEEFSSRFNLVSLFVNEINLIKTQKHPKSSISTYENVYRQYESFCELQDEEAISKTKFNRELKALGFEATRRESGNVWFAKFA